MKKMTYAGSGVDIRLENRSIDAMKSVLTSKRKGFGAPMTEIGHYAGLPGHGELCTGHDHRRGSGQRCSLQMQ